MKIYINYNLKRVVTKLMILVVSSFCTYGGIPTVGTITSNRINYGTGTNFIIVNGISNGGDGSQTLTVSATSSDNTVLSIVGVSYTQGHSMAVIEVQERQKFGSAIMTVTATDADGPVNKPFTIQVGRFYQTGGIHSLFDARFWTRLVPREGVHNSVKDTIIPSADIYQWLGQDVPGGYWWRTSLSVGVSDLTTDSEGYVILPETGNNRWFGTAKGAFYIQTFRTIFIPTLTGIYFFRARSQDGNRLEIYPTEIRSGITKGVVSPGGNTGTATDTVWLHANKPYGIQGTGFVVFTDNLDIDWAYGGTNPAITMVSALDLGFVATTTPGYNPATLGQSPTTTGLNWTLLGGPIYPYYDFISPTSPQLTLKRKGTNLMDIMWTRSTDNVRAEGYKIYVNGVFYRDIKNIKDTVERITNLSANTQYTIGITAYDQSGNESRISNLIFESTFPIESTPPLPPSSIVADVVGDMSAKISWTGASDAQSGIFGYKVFVNGTLYNKDTLAFNHAVLKTYNPREVLNIQIEAIDGNGNISAKSNPFTITLAGFDINLSSPEIKKASMNFSADFIGRQVGIGTYCESNSSWLTGPVNALVRSIKPAVLRIGGIDPASQTALTDRIGPNARGNLSYGRFIVEAAKMNAWASFTIGMDNSPPIDWRLDPEGTAQALMDYLTSVPVPGKANSFYLNQKLSEGLSGNLLLTTPGVIVELGNEPWGGTSNGAPGTVDHQADGFNNYVNYRQWARKIARAIKASPGYDSTKIHIAISGRNPRPSDSYGLTETMFEGTENDKDVIDIIAISGYMGGNFDYGKNLERGPSELTYYKSGWEALFDFSNGLKQTMDIDIQKNGKIRPFFFYESAQTTSDYNGRLGQAISIMDYWNECFRNGLMHTAVFGIPGGGEWANVTQQGFRKPGYFTVKYFNEYAKGDILSSSWASKEKVFGNTRRIGSSTAIEGMAPVGMYAYYQAGVYKLVFLSRDFENDFQVQVNMPGGINNSTKGKQFRLYGSDFSTDNTIIDSTEININDKMIVTVPKFTMVIITFGGAVLNNIPLPLGYTKYKKPTGFNILDVTENTIDPVELSYLVTFTGGAANTAMNWKISPEGKLNYNISTGTITIGGVVTEFMTLGVTNKCFTGDLALTVTGWLKDDPNIPAQSVVTNITNTTAFDPAACPTSIRNNGIAADLRIFPNPANSVVTISSQQEGLLSVINAKGSIVKKLKLQPGVEMNVLDLEAGIYILKFENILGITTKKLIVNKE